MRCGFANAMTSDVEDYFQVEAFASTIDRSDWESLPRRVERNTERLLRILAECGVEATFFILGWVAERHPQLVRRVVAQGHELASHGSGHLRADRQSPEEFRDDVRRSKRVLEDFGGVPVRGYRAPTFSIGGRSKWAPHNPHGRGLLLQLQRVPGEARSLRDTRGAANAFFTGAGHAGNSVDLGQDHGTRHAGLGRRLFPPAALPGDQRAFEPCEASEPLASGFLSAPLGDRS